MKNILQKLSVLIFAGALLGGCFVEPDYPPIPDIAFKSVSNSAGQYGDTVRITITFKDGDGDLGLSSEDTLPPFSPEIGGVTNPDFFNFHLRAFKKSGSDYIPLTFTEGSGLNGRFPPLNTRNKTSALEGELTYSVQFFYIFSGFYTPKVQKGDILRFEAQISDRALNRSNLITTEDIIVGQ